MTNEQLAAYLSLLVYRLEAAVVAAESLAGIVGVEKELESRYMGKSEFSFFDKENWIKVETDRLVAMGPIREAIKELENRATALTSAK
jgi:hypothetical protein